MAVEVDIEAYVPAVRLVKDSGLREAVNRTWIAALKRSAFGSFEDVPQSVSVPGRSLLRHVNDVNRLAVHFADVAASEYGLLVDRDVALAGAILHDVDKAFMLGMEDGVTVYLPGLSIEDHGRLGAELAEECGVPRRVSDLIRFHAPFNYYGHLPATAEGAIVHYADLAAADFGAIQFHAEPIFARSIIVNKDPRILEFIQPGGQRTIDG